MAQKSKSLPWDVVEVAIGKEVKWLESTIVNSPFADEQSHCTKCTFRDIAILIISGKVQVKDINSSQSLWGEDRSFPVGKEHGKEWHSQMMQLVATYFHSLKYKVVLEPNLYFGRADLGVYKKGAKDLFVEIGSISINKLLNNLKVMEGSDILVVLDIYHAVKFSIIGVNYPSKLTTLIQR